MIVDRYVDMAGKIRIWWKSTVTGEVYMFKFNSEPTTEQLQVLSDAQDDVLEVNRTDYEEITLSEDYNAIYEIVTKIKENPNVTFNQYSNYLTSLNWTTAATIRYFIYRFALKLAQKYSVSVGYYTEQTAFIQVRNFIADTPVRKLAKMILNRTDF
jgi:hypothetical protein